jgi:hypothetical protein
MKQKHEKKDGAYLKIKRRSMTSCLLKVHFTLHQVITNNNEKEIRLVCSEFKNDDVEA